MSDDSALLEWIRNYLSALPNEVDVDVLSEYVYGVLEEIYSTNTEVLSELEGLLSAYLPENVCKTASTDIVNAFNKHRNPASDKPNGQNGGLHSELLSMEEQMRAMMRADCERVIDETPQTAAEVKRERDACTTAVLREAGVAGYQGDSEEEKSVEIAITNAQFRAKQRLDVVSGRIPVDATTVPDLVPHESPESEIDLDNLEDISGYGKKDEVKPGTVEDALSVLNPSLFGASCSVAARPFPIGVSRLPTPGPRPPASMDFRLPIAVTQHKVITAPAARSDEDCTGSRRAERKKKAPIPSKHIAKVAAQAEAKSSQKVKGAAPTGPARGLVRARQDEMDAFLFSDSASDADDASAAPLPEGANNREKVKAAEEAARQAAAAAAAQRRAEERASRTKQIQQAAERKQTAQKKAQKVERRRC